MHVVWKDKDQRRQTKWPQTQGNLPERRGHGSERGNSEAHSTREEKEKQKEILLAMQNNEQCGRGGRQAHGPQVP